MNKSTLKLALLPLFITTGPLPAAAIGKVHTFGKNAPFTVNELPAGSQLRRQLDALPESIRKQAMQHLHEFNFPEEDAEHLNVSPTGRIFYTDPPPAKAKPSSPLIMRAEPQSMAALPEIDVFKLHTHPGSKNRVFLDFDGMILTGTEWNVEAGRRTLRASPFDLDGNSSTFNTAERTAIHEIWHRIAEDYAPFNIDVTTEAPVGFTQTTGHILFTRSRDTMGYLMPSYDAGGIAFSGVWDDPEYVSAYSPALVYYDNLGNSDSDSMAEAGAHEFGHNFGLSHDGTSSSGYYEGTGSGFVSWAPIMGVSYYDQVTQWSKGEYPNANNKEDDVAIIGGLLGVLADDHGNDLATASQLQLDSDGKISVTTPQTDPGNTDPYNKGIIGSRADIDMFFFDTQGGTINFVIEPAWTAFYRNETRGANLDIKATLYNSAGTALKIDDPTNDTDANITTSLGKGRYYLAVEGVGNSLTPYSDYNSMGKYYISGAITAPDTEPPTPNPMTWAYPPTLLTDTSITMTANTATDNLSAVQYQFVCTYGGSGCVSSAWQASPSYVAKNISKGTYRYVAKARDASGNETASSEERAVLPNVLAATDDHASVAEDQFVIIYVLDNDTDPNGGKLTISRYTQGANGKVIKKQGGLQYKPNKNFNGTDGFSYTVANSRKGSATATVNLTVTPINDAPKAKNDSVTLRTNGFIEIQPLSNDSDIDGDTLKVSSVSSGKKGVASNNGGTISYQAGQQTGIDKFTYSISDGHGGTAQAVISVSIKKP
ncbi:MAG: tandem-95 repeat protein [Methylococcales bacterium]|nr:tandem-95 repeat protein [Methylococcales bacterium]